MDGSLRFADGDARCAEAWAASDLKLAPKLSFDDDSSPNFPIQGQNLSEGSKPSGEATVIFFGTSNCWNTAREAERLVKLYPQFRDRIRFVIVDLNHVGPEQEALVSHYYHGYIPTITTIDSKGNLIYDRAGETASTRGDTSDWSDCSIRFTSQPRVEILSVRAALSHANPLGGTV
jgi:hypothetical protein